MEADDAGVRHAARRLPGDAPVPLPVGDLAFPVALAEPDLLVPGDLAVLGLHVQDAVHELRELLELRPPLVRRLPRDGDVGEALDRQPAGLLRGASPASAAERLRRDLPDRAEAASAGALDRLLRALRPVPADLLGLTLGLLLDLARALARRVGDDARGGRDRRDHDLLAHEPGEERLRSALRAVRQLLGHRFSPLVALGHV